VNAKLLRVAAALLCILLVVAALFSFLRYRAAVAEGLRLEATRDSLRTISDSLRTSVDSLDIVAEARLDSIETLKDSVRTEIVYIETQHDHNVEVSDSTWTTLTAAIDDVAPELRPLADAVRSSWLDERSTWTRQLQAQGRLLALAEQESGTWEERFERERELRLAVDIELEAERAVSAHWREVAMKRASFPIAAFESWGSVGRFVGETAVCAGTGALVGAYADATAGLIAGAGCETGVILF
jgi:hypothetical protein